MPSLIRFDESTTAENHLKTLLPATEGFFSGNPTPLDELHQTPMTVETMIVLEVKSSAGSRWLMLEQWRKDAIRPVHHFPCRPLVPGVLPAANALAAVTEELVLLEKGLPLDWRHRPIRIHTVALDWLTACRVSICDEDTFQNKLLIVYHAAMEVADPGIFELRPRRRNSPTRPVLARIIEAEQLVAHNQLCQTSARSWASHWRHRP